MTGVQTCALPIFQIKFANSYTGFQLIFHELENSKSELIFENDTLTVKTIPLKHRIYTNGFLFKEKNTQRKINIDAVLHHEIELVYFNKIKNGGDVTKDDGTVVKNAQLTFDPEPEKSYAFCSDTAYYEAIIPVIKNCTVLYHESTFLDSELHLTDKTKHCTAKQAALIAKQALVSNLILGHYSTRYGSLEAFKTEAQTIFEPVFLADDGVEFEF